MFSLGTVAKKWVILGKTLYVFEVFRVLSPFILEIRTEERGTRKEGLRKDGTSNLRGW